MRSNVDKLITFGQASLLERKALAEQYFSGIPQSEVFRLIDTYAFRPKGKQERYFLLLDVTNESGDTLENTLYQGCATATPPFMLGTRDYWGPEYELRIEQLRSARQNELSEG